MTVSFVWHTVVFALALTVSVGTAYKMTVHGIKGPALVLAPLIFVFTLVGVPLILFQALLFAPEKLDGADPEEPKTSEIPVFKRAVLGIEVLAKIMVLFPTVLGCVVSVIAEAYAAFREHQPVISDRHSVSKTDEVAYQVWELAALA